MRRILAANSDVIATEYPAEPSSEQYSLFRRYLDHRHQQGGMSDMSVLDYAMMVEDTHVNTRIIEYRRREEGVGLGAAAEGRADRRGADRQDGRRAVDGLFLLRSRSRPPLARHLHDPRPYPRTQGARACRMSISAIGSRVRARWTTRRVSAAGAPYGPRLGALYDPARRRRQITLD